MRNVSTNLSAPVNTNYQTYDRLDGGRFNYRSLGQIVTTIKFSIRSNTLEVLDKLNILLQTSEEKVLYLEDQPDRYLMAMYSGETGLNRRYYGSTGTLTFISSKSYWYSMDGEKIYNMDMSGRFLVPNNGTASTAPKFTFTFLEESGYLGIVSPNGFITLGDKEEKDRLQLPKQEVVMDEEMDAVTLVDDWLDPENADPFDKQDWINLEKNDYHSVVTEVDGSKWDNKGLWVPDYNGLNIGTGTRWTDAYGSRLKKAASPLIDKWNSWGLYRYLDYGLDPTTREIRGSWRFETRLTFYDASGNTKGTGMFLMVVMDYLNRPIATISVYNIFDNSNSVTITAKINDNNGASHSSKIIKTAYFPGGFDGLLKIESDPSGHISFEFDSSRSNRSVYNTNSIERFIAGNTAYIRKDAAYGYGYDGSQHTVKDFTRGRPYYVQATRTYGGKKQYLISYQGVQIYWMNEGDITANKSEVGKTDTQIVTDAAQNVKHSVYAPELVKLAPNKVLVLGGTWSSSNAFTNSSINSVKMFKLNGDNSWMDINNVFQPKDILTIDNKTSEILLNGAPFSGFVDYDSKFFDVDAGIDTEIQVVTSSWSAMPEGKIHIEERFR